MPRQLDIFEDSRDVALRNDIAAAIARGDVDAARCAMAALQAEFGADPALEQASRLIAALQVPPVSGPPASTAAAAAAAAPAAAAAAPADPAALLAERATLETELAAAARGLLGADAATPWLAAQWRRLAERARGVPWRAEWADVHAAALYLQARAWPEAAAAVERIESWRRIPQPLAWMTLARWRLAGADAGWPLLAELLWLAPTRARELMGELSDAALSRLVRGFEIGLDPPDDQAWAWLPAWALVEQPLLLRALEPAQPPAERAQAQGFALVATLLRLERQGRHADIVEQRRRLRFLSEPLFAAYMKTR